MQAITSGTLKVHRVTFIDKKEAAIYSFNPANQERSGPIHRIEDNEELIGVYGVRNKFACNSFSSFGFIVKVR